MISNPISAAIAGQIPEHIRGDSPLFVGFLETYYKYAEQRQKAVGIVQNRYLDADIDNTLEAYVAKFYSTYASYLPKEMAMDRRNFIKLLNRVYEAKGTEKSLKLVFRALYGEEISISLPFEKILKASDGVWERESFITILKQFGNPQQVGKLLSISNSSGTFSINVIRQEEVGDDLYRYYFKSYTKISVVDNQIVFAYDGDLAVFAGNIVKSPSELIILDPGKFWQRGQVVVIPGSKKNTIARVTLITPLGGIKAIEILEHGYTHIPNQTTSISPFNNKLNGGVVDISSVLVSINPPIYSHRINIKDALFEISETINGFIGSAVGAESYVAVEYASDYTPSGSMVINKSENATSLIFGGTNENAETLEDYLDSRVTMFYKETSVVNTKGYYRNDLGQISNQEIRMQDNYFYQAFSYLIDTKKDIREYQNILPVTHPSGTKLFADLNKTVDFSFAIESSRTISLDTVYLRNAVFTGDVSNKSLIKLLTEFVPISDSHTVSAIKYLNDSVLAIANETAVLTLEMYAQENYFLEDYNGIEYQLKIG